MALFNMHRAIQTAVKFPLSFSIFKLYCESPSRVLLRRWETHRRTNFDPDRRTQRMYEIAKDAISRNNCCTLKSITDCVLVLVHSISLSIFLPFSPLSLSHPQLYHITVSLARDNPTDYVMLKYLSGCIRET